MSNRELSGMTGKEREDLARDAMSSRPRKAETFRKKFNTLCNIYSKNAYELYKGRILLDKRLKQDPLGAKKTAYALNCVSVTQKEMESYLNSLVPAFEKIDPDADELHRWVDMTSEVSRAIAKFEDRRDEEEEEDIFIPSEEVDPDPEEYEFSDNSADSDPLQDLPLGEVLRRANAYTEILEQEESVKDRLENHMTILYNIRNYASQGIKGISDLVSYIEAIPEDYVASEPEEPKRLDHD